MKLLLPDHCSTKRVASKGFLPQTEGVAFLWKMGTRTQAIQPEWAQSQSHRDKIPLFECWLSGMLHWRKHFSLTSPMYSCVCLLHGNKEQVVMFLQDSWSVLEQLPPIGTDSFWNRKEVPLATSRTAIPKITRLSGPAKIHKLPNITISV